MIAPIPPPLILVCAFVPALLWLVGSWIWLRPTSQRFPESLLGFASGAVLTAPTAAVFNQLAGQQLAAPAWANTVVAPLLEETLKATAVLLLGVWAVASSRRQLLRHGLWIGLGFTATENTQYLLFGLLQGGPLGLANTVFVRGLCWGLHHALFAATGAVAVSYLVGGRRSLPWAGVWLFLAVIQHVAWNSFGAPWVTTFLCAATQPGAACQWPPLAFDLYVVTPLISAAMVLPGALVLAYAYRQSPPSS